MVSTSMRIVPAPQPHTQRLRKKFQTRVTADLSSLMIPQPQPDAKQASTRPSATAMTKFSGPSVIAIAQSAYHAAPEPNAKAVSSGNNYADRD